MPSGKWLGIDGSDYYLIQIQSVESEDQFEIETNADLTSWDKLFSLDSKWQDQLREVIRRGPELQVFLDQFKGIRTMRPQSITETLFSFLCTSNNHIKRIQSMVQKLGERGEFLAEIEGTQLHGFPTLETIAMVSEEELRFQGFGYRAKTIPLVAQQLLNRGGEDYLSRLYKMGCYDEIIRELLSLPGIGPKLADCIALFGFHSGCAVPFDTHLWKIATRLYFPEWEGTSLTDKKYREASAFFRSRFGELSGLAHHILFFADLDDSRSHG